MKLHTVILTIVPLLCQAQEVPPPPQPEPVKVVELPLPPVAPTQDEGACNKTVNPHRTGCIGQVSGNFQSGDFTPDGRHVLANVEFVGAPASPDPASVYSGEQLILIKTDGSVFSNGDAWKCLSCGVPVLQAQALNPERDYPHVARNGRQALWGNNILECGGALLESDDCSPHKTYIYPIYWPTSTNTTAPSGSMREMRMHPDDVHMGWSSFTANGENSFFGRLLFNSNPTTGSPRIPRYDLVDVNILIEPQGPAPIMAQGNELKLHDDAILVGELRGFSGSGDEILYVGPTREANNIDIFAVHVVTGAVRRLTSHPEYADPIAFSHDNQWFVTMDTRGSNRQMWMAGMRHVPPLIDLVASTAAASTRNNGARRFFQPILIDRYGDRGTYFGQRVNTAGNGSYGSVNDPDWNGRADPAFSPDGTCVVFWQALVIPPACGGRNPLECPISTAQGGRTYRLMLARLTSRQPTIPAPVYKVPDMIPWAMRFQPGATIPARYLPPAGNYTLSGRATGLAHVRLTTYPGSGDLKGVDVDYANYSDDGHHFLNGYESVTRTLSASNPWLNHLDWFSNLRQTGATDATKITGLGGFHLSIDALTNIFEANGTLTTTIDGVVYKQPENGT